MSNPDSLYSGCHTWELCDFGGVCNSCGRSDIPKGSLYTDDIDLWFCIDCLHASNGDVAKKLQKKAQLIKNLEKSAYSVAVGKIIKITSGYNGQMYGNSKPSLKGKEFEVTGVSIDGSGVWLWLKGHDVGVHLNEVEFKPPQC